VATLYLLRIDAAHEPHRLPNVPPLLHVAIYCNAKRQRIEPHLPRHFAPNVQPKNKEISAHVSS